MGYALARMLFPNSVDHETDFLSGEAVETFASAAVSLNETESLFHPRVWLDPETEAPFTNASYSQGPLITRGGKQSRFLLLLISHVLDIRGEFSWTAEMSMP